MRDDPCRRAGDAGWAENPGRARVCFRLALVLIGGAWCTTCGHPEDLSQVGPVPPPVQIILTEQTHPDGWGLAECLLCHPVFQIHQRSSDPNVDLEEIRRIVDESGQGSCVFCHGSNGT